MSLLYRIVRIPDSSGISVALSLFILLGLSLAIATNKQYGGRNVPIHITSSDDIARQTDNI